MNQFKFSKLLMAMFIPLSIGVGAQNFQTMGIQSGFTADVIANGVGSSMVSTSIDVDGVSYAFVSKDFQLTSSSTPLTYGLPANGQINSVVSSTPGLSYQLANYTGNNSLRLQAANDSGTLTFTTPIAATKLYMLITSGSGTSTVTAVVNFTDGTSQTFTSLSISDWYGGSNFAVQGFGRIKRTNDALEPNSNDPRLYQVLLTLDAANQTKPIQSVTVTKTVGNGLPNVFAFSADVYSTCANPALQPVGTVTANTANVSWTVPTGATISSYDIYYSTTNTVPATPNVTGVTGTSYTIPSLSPSTTYYYWVKSNCTPSGGAMSFSGTFTTPCAAIGSFPWTENFDSMTSIGSGVLPNSCWKQTPGNSSYNFTTANASSQSYNDPKSAPNYITIYYPYNSAAYLWTPQFAMTAGQTYTFSFYWVGDGYTGWQNEVLINNIQAASGATSLVTFINPTQVATGGSNSTNYTQVSVNYTPTATGNFSFGIKAYNTTSAPYYMGFDDFSVTTSNLATNEVASQKDAVKIHPNPFTDVLNIADISKVKSVSVMDLSGKVVKSFDKPESSLRLSDLNSGMYLVVLNMMDGTKQTIKAIKK